MKKAKKIIASIMILAMMINISPAFATEISETNAGSLGALDQTEAGGDFMMGSAVEYSDLPAVVIKSASLSLGSEIGVNFYFDFSSAKDACKYDNFVDVTTIRMNDETYKVGEFSDGGDTKCTYYISPKAINKEIRVTLNDKDGKVIRMVNQDGNEPQTYSNGTFVYTAKNYINDVLSSSDVSANGRKLIYSLDLYSQMARSYFDYDTESLVMDKNLEDVDLSKISCYKKVIDCDDFPSGLSYIGSSVLFNNSYCIRHYFKVTDGAKISDYDFYENIDGAKYEQNPHQRSDSGDTFYIEISDITIVDIGTPYSISVSKKGDTDNSWTIDYAIMHYVYDVLSGSNSDQKLIDLCKALYSYYTSAVTASGYDVKTPLIEKDGFSSFTPYSGDLGQEAYRLISANVESFIEKYYIEYSPSKNTEVCPKIKNYLMDWYKFQLAALKEVPNYGYKTYTIKDGETQKDIYIYNTDGTASGIHIYDGVSTLTETVEETDEETGKKTEKEICTEGLRGLAKKEKVPGTEGYTNIVTNYYEAAGKWYGLSANETEDTYTFTYEIYDGKWKEDMPSGSFDYWFYTVTIDKTNGYINSLEKRKYNSISKNGLFDGECKYDIYISDNYGTILYYKPTFSSGYVNYNTSITDENASGYYHDGLTRIYPYHSSAPSDAPNRRLDNYIEIDTKAIFKVNGVDSKDYLAPGEKMIDLLLNDTYIYESDRMTYLNEAYRLITADTIDYEAWNAFATKMRQVGIHYGCFLAGKPNYGSNVNKVIGIYGGYGKSDVNKYGSPVEDFDIYIYYGEGDLGHGPLIPAGEDSGIIRNGQGKLVCASSYEVTEADTGYKDITEYYEVLTGTWENDIPVGTFTKDTYSTIYTSTKLVNLHKKYTGNVKNTDSPVENDKYSYYRSTCFDGEVNWTSESTITNAVYDYKNGKLVLGSPVSVTRHYKATYDNGTIKTDNVDSEGYTYIDCTDAGCYEQERVSTKRILSVGGYYRKTFTNAEDIYNTYTKDLSVYTVDGLTEGSTKYNNLSGNETAKKYSDALFEDAMLLATENAESWDTWNRLKAKARAASITYESPLIAKLSSGKYIGIYGSKDNTSYYIYYGEMDNFQRSGQGIWITGLESTANYDSSNVVSARNLQKFSGSWSGDLPNGSFTESNTTWITKPSYSSKIVRSYRGNVSKGAFEGLINWTVKSETRANDEVKSSSTHSYSARFSQGIIQGYMPDRTGCVRVSELNSGITEDVINYYTQYGYGGLAYTSVISGDSIIYGK